MSYSDVILTLCLLVLGAQGWLLYKLTKGKDGVAPGASPAATRTLPMDKGLWRVAGRGALIREDSPTYKQLRAQGASLLRLGD